MGIVYKGFDPIIGRTVALKTITFDMTDDESKAKRARLYREAGAAGTLSHANIVTIYDVIEEGNTSAVAMEFIEGRPLSDVVKELAPMPIESALDIFEQLCAALDYAGARGIVHRDIKPANVMVAPTGRVKVADFGIARMGVSHMTQTGVVMGSPAYMSPEQIRGQPLDARSDLFSATIVFYELLTGQRPFSGDDLATTMFRIVHEPPIPASTFNDKIGPPLDKIFEKGFSKEPKDRYRSGAELCADFRQAWRTAGSTLAVSAAVRRLEPQSQAKTPDRTRLYAGVGLAAVLVILALGGFLGGWFGQKPAPASAQQVAAAPAGPSIAVAGPASKPSTPSPAAGAPPPAAPAVPTAVLQLKFDGASFPVRVFADGKPVGRIDNAAGRVTVPSGSMRIRALGEQAFFDRDFGSMTLQAGERRSLTVPATASAFIGVKGDVYEGLQILIDGRSVPGSYPAQLARITAVPHRITFRWSRGTLADKQLSQSIDLSGGRHFLIRAVPDDNQVSVQKVR
ncbi:MAG: serine/threonine protein kinase [Acidobacteria bacterium]|nr:serine/threonine protein kinase [Acidobacteriota bacterium]